MSKSTLDYLERPIRTMLQKRCAFGAQHKNLNPYCQRQKCRPMSLVSGDIRFMRIFAEEGRRRRQTTVGLSTSAIFSIFAGYFFGNIREGQRYYKTTRSTSSAFEWSQSAWPWMTLNGYVALNSVFVPVWWLARTDRATFEQEAQLEKQVVSNAFICS